MLGITAMLCRYIKLYLHVHVGVHVFESFNEKDFKMHSIIHVTLSSIIVCVIYAFNSLLKSFKSYLNILFYFVEWFFLKKILKFNDTEI